MISLRQILDRSSLYYNNALEMIQDNDITNAIKELEKSIDLYSSDTDTLNLLGLCLYYKGNFNEALKYWSLSIKIEETANPAVRYISMMKSEDNHQLISLYNQAIEHAGNGNMINAIEILKNTIGPNYTTIEPLIFIGLCYMDLEKYDEALDYFRKAEALDSGDERLRKYIMSCQKQILNENNYKKRKNIRAKITIAITSILILASGVIFYQFKYYNNKYEQVINKYNTDIRAVVADRNSLEDKYNLLLRDYEELKSIRNKENVEIIKTDFINQKQEQEYFNKGINYYNNSDYINARTYFENLLSNGVELNLIRETTYFLAITYEKLGQIDHAIDAYTEYINKYPNSNYYDDSLYNLGLLYYQSGNRVKAIEVLNKLYNENPDSIFVNSKVKYILNK